MIQVCLFVRLLINSYRFFFFFPVVSCFGNSLLFFFIRKRTQMRKKSICKSVGETRRRNIRHEWINGRACIYVMHLLPCHVKVRRLFLLLLRMGFGLGFPFSRWKISPVNVPATWLLCEIVDDMGGPCALEPKPRENPRTRRFPSALGGCSTAVPPVTKQVEI